MDWGASKDARTCSFPHNRAEKGRSILRMEMLLMATGAADGLDLATFERRLPMSARLDSLYRVLDLFLRKSGPS
jgi:hypothetical protein